jgi:hypothetical protein
MITHQKVSAVPSIPGAWVQPSDWNNAHLSIPALATYAANAAIPNSGVDVIQGIGGAGGIQLTLDGVTGQSPAFFAMKTDAGVGAVSFIDANGANFVALGGAAASYNLVNQGQWAIFIWNVAEWLVFGV